MMNKLLLPLVLLLLLLLDVVDQRVLAQSGLCSDSACCETCCKQAPDFSNVDFDSTSCSEACSDLDIDCESRESDSIVSCLVGQAFAAGDGSITATLGSTEITFCCVSDDISGTGFLEEDPGAAEICASEEDTESPSSPSSPSPSVSNDNSDLGEGNPGIGDQPSTGDGAEFIFAIVAFLTVMLLVIWLYVRRKKGNQPTPHRSLFVTNISTNGEDSRHESEAPVSLGKSTDEAQKATRSRNTRRTKRRHFHGLQLKQAPKELRYDGLEEPTVLRQSTKSIRSIRSEDSLMEMFGTKGSPRKTTDTGTNPGTDSLFSQSSSQSRASKYWEGLVRSPKMSIFRPSSHYIRQKKKGKEKLLSPMQQVDMDTQTQVNLKDFEI